MSQGQLTILGIVLLTIIAFISLPKILSYYPPTNVNSSSNTPAPIDERLIRVKFVRVCHEIITDQLKAPKTAQFRESLDEDDAITTVGNDLNLVTYVDSENSFGALIRTNFNCSYTRATDMVNAKPI
jgi:hypothetical protein